MLRHSKECKKLARGQQDEEDRSRMIGEEEGEDKNGSVQEDGNERR